MRATSPFGLVMSLLCREMYDGKSKVSECYRPLQIYKFIQVILTRPSKTHVRCQDVSRRYLSHNLSSVYYFCRLQLSSQEMRTLGSLGSLSWHHLTLYRITKSNHKQYLRYKRQTDLILSLLPQNKRTTKLRNKIQLSIGFTKRNKHEDNN